MYMKGADSIVMSRLAKSKPQPFLPKYQEKLTKYSEIGLRTLLFAMKVLSEEEYRGMDFFYKILLKIIC